jgi:2-keto-4-pentenoate hydratase/2-oxohepta-3-ene-1,7-dioic acid hydratase in catechol pathway
MKIIRFENDRSAVCYAAVEGNDFSRAEYLEGDPYQGGLRRTGKPAALPVDRDGMVELLPPIEPTNILCIGLNYRRHADESNMAYPERPVLFIKPTSTVIAPDEPIRLPQMSSEVDYECELAIVIGRAARDVSEADALDYVLGYTCANDVSARDWQLRMDRQWARGKSFDTFCPLGPVVVTADEIPDPDALAISTVLSGETVQKSNTADMIFSTRHIISYLSQGMTLLPGTVILTGTPEGVGMGRTPNRWLKPGDVCEITIEGIGTLRNPVVAG